MMSHKCRNVCNFLLFIVSLLSTENADFGVLICRNKLHYCISSHTLTGQLVRTLFSLLLQTFQDQGISNYLVCYLRIIASGYLQKNAEFYLPFLNGYADMKDFCSRVSVGDLHIIYLTHMTTSTHSRQAHEAHTHTHTHTHTQAHTHNTHTHTHKHTHTTHTHTHNTHTHKHVHMPTINSARSSSHEGIVPVRGTPSMYLLSPTKIFLVFERPQE